MDKRPAENVGKMIVEDNKAIQEKQSEIDQEQKGISKGIHENQKKIRNNTKIWPTEINQLDETKD